MRPFPANNPLPSPSSVPATFPNSLPLHVFPPSALRVHTGSLSRRSTSPLPLQLPFLRSADASGASLPPFSSSTPPLFAPQFSALHLQPPRDGNTLFSTPPLPTFTIDMLLSLNRHNGLVFSCLPNSHSLPPFPMFSVSFTFRLAFLFRSHVLVLPLLSPCPYPIFLRRSPLPYFRLLLVPSPPLCPPCAHSCRDPSLLSTLQGAAPSSDWPGAGSHREVGGNCGDAHGRWRRRGQRSGRAPRGAPQGSAWRLSWPEAPGEAQEEGARPSTLLAALMSLAFCLLCPLLSP